MDVKAYDQNDEIDLNAADIYLFKVCNGNNRTMFVVIVNNKETRTTPLT